MPYSSNNPKLALKNALYQLRRLPDQPESDMHALRPTEKAFESADALLNVIGSWEGVPEPMVVVTPERGIEMEWHKGPRKLAIDLLPNGRVEFLQTERGQIIEERELDTVNVRLAETVLWLNGRENERP